MRFRGTCQLAALIGTAIVAGCQSGPDGSGDTKSDPAPPAAAAEAEQARTESATAIDWTSAGDCKAQLRRLLEAVEEGAAPDPEDMPFAVLVQPTAGGQSWLTPSASYLRADLPIPVYERRDGEALSAPCLIEIGPAHDVDVEQQVMATEEVRSAYQTGTRSENNPEYDVARQRVRQAERRLKDSQSGVLQVGDPLLDLVGMLVGGVLTGLDEYGEEEELERALAELARTPRKIDRPKHRAYHFERTAVRAGKAAVIPVTLIDRGRERSWRVELRQRELREFYMLDGLDPRDRQYEQHRKGSMTRAELERWSRRAPPIDLSTAAGAVLGSSPDEFSKTVASTEPVDRSDDSGEKPRDERTRPPDRSQPEGLLRQLKGPETASQDAPEPFAADYRPEAREAGRDARAAGPHAEDERLAGVVGVTAGEREGSGVYVDRYLVLTSYQLVQGTTVVDVSTADGETVAGLLKGADPGRDLALVQVPRTGRPIAWHAGLRLPQASLVEVLFGDRRARTARIGPDGDAIRVRGGMDTSGVFGAPVFLGAEAIGMIAALGDAGGGRYRLVAADAIARFLEREQVTLAGH